MKILIAITINLILFSSCIYQNNQEKISIKDFYFPYDEFVEHTTYCYVNSIDTTDKTYWRMNTRIEGKDTLFITDILDSKKNKIEYLVEKISSNGSVMVEYILYNKEIIDSCRLIENTIYNWHMFKGETINWKVVFTPLGSDQTIKLSKERKFIDIDAATSIAKFRDEMKIQLL